MPERIQMSRQHPWRPEHPTAIIVDRTTVYGNPFAIGSTVKTSVGVKIITTAEQAVHFHREWMEGRLELQQSRPQIAYLRGSDLACWCAEDAPFCHADTLLELANA